MLMLVYCHVLITWNLVAILGQGFLEQGYLPNLIRMFNKLVHDDQVVPEDGHRVGNIQLDQVVHGNLEKVQSGFQTS